MKKKFLILCNYMPPSYGGGYLRVARMASRFKDKGFLDKIITYTSKDIYKQFNSIVEKDIIFLSKRFMSQFNLASTIWRRKESFDILYIASANWYTTIAALCAKLLQKKIIVGITLSQSDSPAHRQKNALLKPYYLYKNWQFKLADKMYVLSPLLLEECLNCGFSKDKVKLINNPVDTKIYHPITIDEKERIRKSIGINNNWPTFIFIGGISKRKGFDIFPQLFETYFKQTANKINFVVCGKRSYSESEFLEAELQSIFNKYGAKLLINDSVSDTYKYYQMADLFLFPTRNEGMPNVVLEAMSCGCNILCNRLPGITDYVLTSDNLVCNNDIDEYITKMIQFDKDNTLVENILRKNYNRIINDFTIQVVDDLFIKSIN